MSTLKIQSFLLTSIAALSLLSFAGALDSETPTAYDMIEEFDFPKGILPEGVQSYELKGDGTFTVLFKGNCEFKVDGGYLLKYGSKITGRVNSGTITDLRGVSVKVLFACFGINGVVQNDGELHFYVGPLSASFPTSNFEECPRCRCGFDCANADAACWPSRNFLYCFLPFL